ncbi:hypothetical protein BO78DRAFT_428817 [Aspergillus sclerotiicarbonarius CBS 121057]|uniref:Oxidase ustYa n=1 Tax=Aspergillus sclerotiicarbonarius (strain CBS 121057 / IBT 28362) TaxID=1448318 RepID=A0A319EJA0_ASPSB|nr:hypothetical protein BO78DRAFT_428817 [Aspergillus sclerotiicarbonarius CBS 121057]
MQKPTSPYPRATGLAILISTLIAMLYILILRNIIPPCICPSTITTPPHLSSSPSSYNLQTFFPPQDQQHEHTKSLLSLSQQIPNHGFISITEHPNTNPQTQPQTQFFGISMFHQLHCLDMIRDSINSTMQSGSEGHPHADHTRSYRDMHVGHCLDYLVQAIICAADDTIERGEEEEMQDGKKVKLIEGVGVVHRCRESGYIWDGVAKSVEEPVMVAGEVREGETVGDLLRWESSHLV